MKSRHENWSILTTKEYKDDIQPIPRYQRKKVWKSSQEQLLIDSLLKGIDIPKLYLRELPEGSDYRYEMIDGKQRIKTIWKFLENEMRLNEDSSDIKISGFSYRIADLKYSELDHKIKMEKIYKNSLDMVIVYEATEDEIADLFHRLNNGTPLNPAEVRNAMPGLMGNTIRELANHSFFKKVSFTNKRFAFDQIVAQMMLLELNGGIEETRDRLLTKMYSDYIKIVPSKAIDNLKCVLDLLDLTFENKSKLLNKTAVINLYLLFSYLSKLLKMKKDFCKRFNEWFVMTEPVRSKDTEYKLFMTSSVNSPQSIEGRFRILLLDFLKDFTDIQMLSLDPKRYFDEKQKAEIYSKNKGICQGCFKKLRENGWEADHKIPWIKGGSTTIENGQVLCKPCNLKKRDKLW